jgi:hypothetical protein
VVPHFYVFGSRVKHEVFGNTNGTRAITHERYMGTVDVLDRQPTKGSTRGR